jgi:hypothetical protein
VDCGERQIESCVGVGYWKQTQAKKEKKKKRVER